MSAGRLRIINVPATAGNVTTTVTNPGSGRRLRLLLARIALVCDATVANRETGLRWATTVGGRTLLTLYGATATAGQTKTFGVYPVSYVAGVGAGPGVDGAVGASGLEWGTELSLSVFISGGVAGDSYSGDLYCEDIPA